MVVETALWRIGLKAAFPDGKGRLHGKVGIGRRMFVVAELHPNHPFPSHTNKHMSCLMESNVCGKLHEVCMAKKTKQLFDECPDQFVQRFLNLRANSSQERILLRIFVMDWDRRPCNARNAPRITAASKETTQNQGNIDMLEVYTLYAFTGQCG